MSIDGTKEHWGFARAAAIEVRQDRTTAALVAFFVALGLGIIAALFLGSFSRTESVRGYVTTTTGLTRIVAARAGVVINVAAQEQALVTAGQVLLTIEPGQIASDGDRTTDLEQRALRSRRLALQDEINRTAKVAAGVARDKQRLEADIAATLATISLEERQLKSSLAAERSQLNKTAQLVRERLVTRDRAEGYERIVRDLERQQSELSLRRTQAKRDRNERLSAIENQLNALQATGAQLTRDLADVDAKLDQSRTGRRVDVLAPRAGRLVALPAGAGTTVAEGQFVAAISDPTPEDMVIRLLAPASAAGTVEKGQRVVLKYDAFPYKSFGIARGTVQAISAASSDDPDAAAVPGLSASAEPGVGTSARAAARQTTYLVLVKPDQTTVKAYGTERPVQLGSTLTADIVIERRSLIDWILDPVLAMRGRL